MEITEEVVDAIREYCLNRLDKAIKEGYDPSRKRHSETDQSVMAYWLNLIGHLYNILEDNENTLKLFNLEKIKENEDVTDFEQHYKNIKEGKSTWR